MYNALVRHLSDKFHTAIDEAAEREGMAVDRHRTHNRSVFCPIHLSGVFDKKGKSRAENYLAILGRCQLSVREQEEL